MAHGERAERHGKNGGCHNPRNSMHGKRPLNKGYAETHKARKEKQLTHRIERRRAAREERAP